MAMAMDMNKDNFDDVALEYEKQRISFISDLKRFNSMRGTPIDKIPELGGHEVDLYYLYQKVTSLGGWHKVTNEQLWEDFQEEFGLPRACVNSAEVLKHIYFRHLNLYEKVNHFGQDADSRKQNEDEGPSRKKICLPIETVPLSYNYNQHKLTDALREQHSMCTGSMDRSPYEKIELSLRSGLPNEVDFALNVCILLSTEGKHVMSLADSSHLLRLLMAHVGIFETATCDLQDLYYTWTKSTDRNFLRFWYETVKDEKIKHLIMWKGKRYIQKDLVGSEVLNIGRDLGTLDSEGQRVLQLAVFLLNMSFEEINQKILACCPLVFKFLMLSLYSTYDGLKQLALDTLANLSVEFDMNAWDGAGCPLMMDMLNDALFSNDRFMLVRGLEIISKVSQIQANEDLLAARLRDDAYGRLVELLSVQDIQLIVHTLEAMYKLSKAGDPFTSRLAMVHRSIDTLVSLITIEAQSFGPGSLVGIKVVEYVPPVNSEEEEGDTETQRRPTTVIQPINPDSVNIYQVPSGLLSQAVGGDGSQGASGDSTGPNSSIKAPPPPPPAPVKETVTDILTTTTNWLEATYEDNEKGKVNHVTLFSDYRNFCRKFSLTCQLSSADFLQHVKSQFIKCDVAAISRKNGDTDVYLEGLTKRTSQKPFAIATNTVDIVPKPPVSVSPKPTIPQGAEPSSHASTLRQRLMEPPQGPNTPGRKAQPQSSPNQNKSAGTAYARVGKIGTPVQSVMKGPNGLPLPGNPQSKSSSLQPHTPSHPSVSTSNPSLSNALHGDTTPGSDSVSVKSLLAKKLSQGQPDQLHQNINNHSSSQMNSAPFSPQGPMCERVSATQASSFPSLSSSQAGHLSNRPLSAISKPPHHIQISSKQPFQNPNTRPLSQPAGVAVTAVTSSCSQSVALSQVNPPHPISVNTIRQQVNASSVVNHTNTQPSSSSFPLAQQLQSQNQTIISSNPSQISPKQMIVNGSVVINSNQLACPPYSSSVTVMSGASALQGTAINQSISSPAVAALLASSSQQGSQMVISTPMVANQNTIQRPVMANQVVATNTPLVQRQPGLQNLVIQAQSGAIMVQPQQVVVQGNGPNQVVVQGNGNMAGGSLQQSFMVPQQIPQNSTVNMQGMNILQAQAGQVQPNTIQVAPNVLGGPAQSSVNATVTNNLGQRIVLTRHQTLPVGSLQISSLQNNVINNSSNLCIAPSQQQSNLLIQQPSLASSAHQVISTIPNTAQNLQQVVFQNSTNNSESQTPLCNGSSHLSNGFLGSPESSLSDFPPSPMSSSGIGSDREFINGKLTDADKDGFLKDNDILKLADKAMKLNGFSHSSIQEKQDNNVISNGPVNPTQNNSSQSGVIMNGCIVSNNTSNSVTSNGTIMTVHQNNGSVVTINGSMQPQPVIQHQQFIGTPEQIQQHKQQQQLVQQQPQQQPQLVQQQQLRQARPVVRAGAVGFMQHQQGPRQQPPQSPSLPSPKLAQVRATCPLSPAANSAKRKPPVKGQATPGNQATPAQNKQVLRARGKRKGPETPTSQGAGRPVQAVLEYMCEWGPSCRKTFSNPRKVFLHVFRTHLPSAAESSCQWAACEKLTRKRWSLVSHLQDMHCSEMAMRTACQRRFALQQQAAGNTTISVPPAPPQPMIYPPDAAMQAIRRFSIKPPYAEFSEQREGPVSKHIRLTAALILRNICRSSSVGRKHVLRYEQQLSFHSMSSAEASTALSSCLWEVLKSCDVNLPPYMAHS